MKNLIFACCLLVIAGCINSSTNFSNRGVTYQVTPELIGEKASVSGSPTANDATVNAEKRYETETKANIAQNLTDSSSNNQAITPSESEKTK